MAEDSNDVMSRLLIMSVCTGVGFGAAFLALQRILAVCERSASLGGTHDFHHTHKTPVPRLGGLALVVAFLAVALAVVLIAPGAFDGALEPGVVIGGSVAMFLLGFWDDLQSIGAKRKLLLQVLISASVYFCGFGITQLKLPFLGANVNLHVWGLILTVVWLVGMTNLVNLIDGVDGLAGGICLMLMVLLAYVGYESGLVGLLAAGMLGALLAFLRLNFPPARIYMGDGGAYFLGFLIGITAIVSSHKGTVAAALIAPLFVMALPIVDTAVAILRRGAQGLPIFRPDRQHIHHRLLAAGISRRKLVLGVYGFTMIFLAMGFLAFYSQGRMVPILFGLGLLLFLACAGRLNFSREWFAVGRNLCFSLAMREEIQYALSLSHWLKLEALRAESLECLQTDFIFLVRKLGFGGMKLHLGDSERVWQAPDSPAPTQRTRHVFHGGRGFLELTARLHSDLPTPAKTDGELNPTRQCKHRARALNLSEGEIVPTGSGMGPAGASAQSVGASSWGFSFPGGGGESLGCLHPEECEGECQHSPPSMASSKHFEILSDLATEAWFKAAKLWEKTHLESAQSGVDFKGPVRRPTESAVASLAKGVARAASR